MNKRYLRNINAISEKENERLSQFKVFVAGCGGLGGYLIEELGRLGIGQITAVDGDVFDETNLNRQILATEDSVGDSKAFSARKRMNIVNPEITVRAVQTMIDEDNCEELIKDHDLVMDALDDVKTRILLEEYCEKAGIPMVHGAIAGWYGQVSAIYPGDGTMKKLYASGASKGAEEELGNPSFIPAVVASIQVAEGLKMLLRRGNILQNKLLSINLLDHEYEIFNL